MIVTYNAAEPTRTPKVLEWPEGYSFAVCNKSADGAIIAVLCYCKTGESAANQAAHWNTYPNQPGAKCSVVTKNVMNASVA